MTISYAQLIDLLMRVILDPGDVIINTPPTFGMYSFDCAVNGRTYIRMLNSSRLNRPLAETSSIERYLSVFRTCWTLFDGGVVVDVPRSEAPSFSVDVEGIQKAVKEHNPKILFLTSPNNPDGSVLSDEDLDVLLKLPVLVVLDEAYIEFSGTTKSRITDVTKHDNLIVLRTFSKRAALAGEKSHLGFSRLDCVHFASLHVMNDQSFLSCNRRHARRIWSLSQGHYRVRVACKATLQRLCCGRGRGLCRAEQP